MLLGERAEGFHSMIAIDTRQQHDKWEKSGMKRRPARFPTRLRRRQGVPSTKTSRRFLCFLSGYLRSTTTWRVD